MTRISADRRRGRARGGIGTRMIRYNASMRIRITLSVALIGASIVCVPGCVRRTISITSTPPGALVYLNDREVGRTPLDVDFLYYGEYDVRLVKEDYEPLSTSGDAQPPLWDAPGFDLVAEALPGERQVLIEWHYDLVSTAESGLDEIDGLIERATALREQTETPEGADERHSGGSESSAPTDADDVNSE